MLWLWCRGFLEPPGFHVVVTFRRRGGSTLTRTFLREAEGVDFVRERIAPESTISADEIAHRDLLAPAFDVHRINHSDAYSCDGVHTNLAESFFARLRRMVGGKHHKVGGRLLGAYAAPVSRTRKGYWRQRAA